MAYWMCELCGTCFNRNMPPDTCPHCQKKCSFKDVTCYRPECRGEGNFDPTLVNAIAGRIGGKDIWREDKMYTQENVSIIDLQKVDIFAGVSDYDLEQVAKICSLRTYQAGERCAVQGETTDEVRIVKEGKVTVEMHIEIAPYTQTLNITTLTKGNLFDWSALAEPRALTSSVKCIDKSQIICIKASDLQRIFNEKPSMGLVVMRNLVRIINTRLKESRAQLVRLVVEMIKQGR